MTKTEDRTAVAAVKDILFSNPDGLREVIRAVMQGFSRRRWTKPWALGKLEVIGSITVYVSSMVKGLLLRLECAPWGGQIGMMN